MALWYFSLMFRSMDVVNNIPSAGNEKDEIQIHWHSLNHEEIVEQLNTTLTVGLDSEEAKKRQVQYGLNQLQEAPRPGFLKLVLDQLKGFVILILIVAAVVSAILGEYIDAGAILTIVILNAVLGVVQESRAEESLAALKKMSAPEAQVLRDGSRVSIPAPQLVPGDIVFLEAGNFVPADIRLVEAVNLKVEEAALTGESLPVQKNAGITLDQNIPLGDRKNTVFMGTLVSYGRGKGVVVSTGMHTQLGLIATMLQSVEIEETPLQKRLEELGKTLGIGALSVCGIVFLIGAFRHHGDIKEIVNMFMIAVSLAIAAVPEGLPAIVTISLALGMREMVKRHALIRKLASVETLGSATVICSDKTGTLTQNAMTVTRLWVDGQFIDVTGAGYSPEGDFLVDGKVIDLEKYPAISTALWVSVLNNDAQLECSNNHPSDVHMIGDPTEGSLLVAATKAGIGISDVLSAYPRENEIPFDSIRKRMVTLHAIKHPQDDDISPIYGQEKREWYVVAIKGAPDEVLKLCTAYQGMDDQTLHSLDQSARDMILAAIDQMTQSALRVLGLAYRLIPDKPEEMNCYELEKDLIFSGLIGMIDPPRTEVAPALQKAKTAGMRTIMITGDYPNTARAIAESIGLLRKDHHVHIGSDIDALSPEEMQSEVELTDVYARVSPEHKMKIVEALRANGEVVAMTGDGVNDAPAIKLADIGVAMGITGTDVAKETADMVLTDDNYASIVDAVEQGRVIYSNIRKFVYYLLSCNMGEIMIIFLAMLFGWSSPLTAIQLLWLNLVTDGAPALALGTEKGDPDIMLQRPRPPREPIINKTMWIGIVVQTIAITSVTLGAYYIGKFTNPVHIEFAETMAFVTLSCSELLRAYTSRSEFYPLLKIGFFSNKWMNLAILSSLTLIIVVIYVPFLNLVFNTLPLGWAQWADIIPLFIIPSVAAEITKFALSRNRARAIKQS
jgi:P-type Ca2+ transporter type 2C